MSRINTNVAALNAFRNLQINQGALNKSLERLSSGFRINRASDDPAGLVISEKLRAQTVSLEQAVQNSQRASNLVTTAEGALNEVNALLKSMKDLIIEAANDGALSDDEIAANQAQVDSAIESINRIGNTTQFAGKKLLNGTSDYLTSGVTSEHIEDLAIYSASMGTASRLPVKVTVAGRAEQGFLDGRGDVGSATVTLEISGNEGVEVMTFAAYTKTGEVVTAVNSVAANTGVTAVRDIQIHEVTGVSATDPDYIFSINDLKGIADDTFVGQYVFVQRAGAAAPEGEYREITDFDGRTGTITVDSANPFTAAIGVGDLVEVAPLNKGIITSAVVTGGQTVITDTSLIGQPNDQYVGRELYTVVGAVPDEHSTIVGFNSNTGELTLEGDIGDPADGADYAIAMDGIRFLSGTNPMSNIAAPAPNRTGRISTPDATDPDFKFVDTNLIGLADDTFNGMEFYITNTTGLAAPMGQHATILDFNGALGEITLDTALTADMSEGDSYAIGQLFLREIGTTAALGQNKVTVASLAGYEDDYFNGLTFTSSDLVVAAQGLTVEDFDGKTGELTLSGDLAAALTAGTDDVLLVMGTAPLDSTGFGEEMRISVKAISGSYAVTGSDTGLDAIISVNGAAASVKGLDFGVKTGNLEMRSTLAAAFGTNIGTTNFDIIGGGVNFQLGATTAPNEKKSLGIAQVTASRLGKGGVGYLNQILNGGEFDLDSDPDTAAKIVDYAIDDITGLRSRLGAFQKNTLETNINSLNIAIENIADAESRIRDTDFAAETTEFTRTQILVQAGTAILAQANLAPQSVLQLLG
ncbi:MAG: flagellin [Planctomycetota bacterium]